MLFQNLNFSVLFLSFWIRVIKGDFDLGQVDRNATSRKKCDLGLYCAAVVTKKKEAVCSWTGTITRRRCRTRLPKFKFSANFPIGLRVILQIQIKKFTNA